MVKIFINYNKKSYNWVVYINRYLFLTFLIKNKSNIINKKCSILYCNYLLLLKILRQFGLVKAIKNLSNY